MPLQTGRQDEERGGGGEYHLPPSGGRNTIFDFSRDYGAVALAYSDKLSALISKYQVRMLPSIEFDP